MNFDPEKVEQFELRIEIGEECLLDAEAKDGSLYVRSSDYDRLLALYREICARHWPEPISQINES
jgi:hypothetical protein